jgi:hypothetical protein
MSEENTEKKVIVRRSERGLRLTGHLTIPASRALERIQSVYGNRAYEILSTAVVVYEQHIMNGGLPHAVGSRYQSTPVPGQSSSPARSKAANPTTVALGAAKAVWCEEFGGKLEGNMCVFDKYEVTLAGQTESSVRTVALKEMPDQKEDFKKLILGGYDNVYEAKRAMTGEK